MFGAIAGDIIGSKYEGSPMCTTDFTLFSEPCGYTDDTVCTIAIAWAIMNQADYAEALRTFCKRYTAGYGINFYNWVHNSWESEPYNSYGNGSAMRVSPVVFAFDSEKEVLKEEKKSAEVTHNHPEGIKGGQATALAVFMGRQGSSKAEIKHEITERFGYDLDRTLDEIRPYYTFKISCQESVPESIISFLESDHFEGAVRNAVSLGGDSDTMACIAGGIAEAYYKEIPEEIACKTREKLPDEFLEIIEAFYQRFGLG